MSFSFIESGLHFTFDEIFNGSEMVVVMIGNIRQMGAEKAMLDFMQLGDSIENARFVYIHLDGAHLYDSNLKMSGLLDLEERLMSVMFDLYSFELSVECFQCDPNDSENLSNLLSMNGALYGVYQYGNVVCSFQEHLPPYETLCL